jgi:hypothetical protein
LAATYCALSIGGAIVIAVFAFALKLLLGSLLFFPFLPSQLDLDPVHPPDESNLTLSYCEKLNSDLIEILIVSFQSFC